MYFQTAQWLQQASRTWQWRIQDIQLLPSIYLTISQSSWTLLSQHHRTQHLCHRTRKHRLGCQGTTLRLYYSLPIHSSSTVYTFLKEGTTQCSTFLLLVVSVWCREIKEMVEDGEGTVHSPCLDSTETGMPGSLSLMNGPISLSMPSRARRRFLVHTFPWTRSLSSCRIKEVHVFLSSLPTPSVSNPGPTDQLSPVQPRQTPTAWSTHDILFDVYISYVS